MLINFADPASVAAWLRVAPDRHWPQLKAICKLQPRWADAARQAVAQVRLERAGRQAAHPGA